MAKATVTSQALPPVTLELSGEEAATLIGYIIHEKWPTTEKAQDTLNGIYDALSSAGVTTLELSK